MKTPTPMVHAGRKCVSPTTGNFVELDEKVYAISGKSSRVLGVRKTVVYIVKMSANGTAHLEVISSKGANALPSGSIITRTVASLINRADLTEDMEGFFKSGGEIRHTTGTAGGYLVGRKHTEGGIKGINNSTGQPIEVEGGEVIITAPAVQDNTKREFEGQLLTNKEILSKINSDGGGVAFADGGTIDKCRCTGKSFKFGGQVLSDFQIVGRMNKS